CPPIESPPAAAGGLRPSSPTPPLRSTGRRITTPTPPLPGPAMKIHEYPANDLPAPAGAAVPRHIVAPPPARAAVALHQPRRRGLLALNPPPNHPTATPHPGTRQEDPRVPGQGPARRRRGRRPPPHRRLPPGRGRRGVRPAQRRRRGRRQGPGPRRRPRPGPA